MSQTAIQRERVLRILRQRGESGMTTADVKARPTVDGGAPIERLAARIEELRRAGHHIPYGLKRGPVALYILRPADEQPVPTPPSVALAAPVAVDVTPAPPTEQLFAA